MEEPTDMEIAGMLADVTELLGQFRPFQKEGTGYELRKRNHTDMVYANLHLEGRGLDRRSVAAIASRQIIQGPGETIRLAARIADLYRTAGSINPLSKPDLVRAFQTLSGSDQTGYRIFAVPVFRCGRMWGMPPPREEIAPAIKKLLSKKHQQNHHPIIRSILAHYTFEYYQPFGDYDGILGRLWRQIIVEQNYPVFAIAAVDLVILETRRQYCHTLDFRQNKPNPQAFIKYMLQVYFTALQRLCPPGRKALSRSDRIMYFYGLGMQSFTRKDYMEAIRSVSTATASRDLRAGFDAGLFSRHGTKNKTIYQCRKP